jgi:hypothetical protein
VVREVTAHYLAKPSPLLRDRVVHSLVHLLFNRLQRLPHAASARLPLEGESADFAPTADMREAEKRKRLGLTLSAFEASFGSISPKFDKARLVGMQGQAEMGQPFSEVRKKRFGVIFMLKASDIIVGVSNEDDFPTSLPASPPVCPKVKTVVQVDV